MTLHITYQCFHLHLMKFMHGSPLTNVPLTLAEYLLIGTPQQCYKLASSTISFQQNSICPSTHVRNLGIIFDSTLSYSKHINSLCQTSYLLIGQLRQIRSVLDTNSAKMLANSLISSRLDYCNSLFFGLPDSSIYRLQRIQNTIARVTLPSLKLRDHITPALKNSTGYL
jgi:hypothetical protein